MCYYVYAENRNGRGKESITMKIVCEKCVSRMTHFSRLGGKGNKNTLFYGRDFSVSYDRLECTRG